MNRREKSDTLALMHAPAVTCPSCQSTQVRKTNALPEIVIYECDACLARFTVAVPPR